MTFSWPEVAHKVQTLVDDAGNPSLDDGQCASLRWIAKHIQQHGVILADEVGTGKTRIACALVHAVVAAGGRAAVVVPHGLMHQWQAESKKLGPNAPVPKILTTALGMFRGPADGSDGPKPSPISPEWWLISHGFGAPRVQSNSPLWRYALPSLVRCALTPKRKRYDRRTSWGALWAAMEKERDCVWNGVWRIARDVAHRMDTDPALRRQVKEFPAANMRGNGNNERLRKFFEGPGDGRRITEKLLGIWLGDFDLLVIDEAHKSRESGGEEDGRSRAEPKVLTRLVDDIIRRSEAARRLCVTATPMELDLRQWSDLLDRARCAFDRAKVIGVIKELEEAARQAAIAPDEGARLERLCTAARKFTEEFRPYVTRRRRDEDSIVHKFREKWSKERQSSDMAAHPHRHIERVRVSWTETEGTAPAWADILWAAEAMSHSMRGLSHMDTMGWPRAIRDAYTKLSAGHVSLDLTEVDKDLPAPAPGNGPVTDSIRSKIARTAYWYKRLRKTRNGVADVFPGRLGAELNPDAEHPRILAAVKEIERWTALDEKVLVFGVFLQPLELLRDILNVRQTLRAVDQGLPVAHAIRRSNLKGMAIWQLEKMHAEGVLTGQLASGNELKLWKALSDSLKTYNRLHKTVENHAKKWIVKWGRDPGFLGAVPNPKLTKVLRQHLVSFVIDDFLSSQRRATQPTQKRIDDLAHEFAKDRLRPLLGENGNEDSELAEQLSRRQTILPEALLGDGDSRQSPYARFLHGETQWSTRRYIQAAFNRPGASPQVLIAQSQVGREGLNLHESCRVVIQFHAEWNPAVLEQQIGRVDRKGSLWERRAQEWLKKGMMGEAPFIEVRQLVFEGTYDAFQWDRVDGRKYVFDASLFGSLLPLDMWHRVPHERLAALRAAAPSFRPIGER